MNWLDKLTKRIDDNKEVLENKKEKYDCKKDGHVYEIVRSLVVIKDKKTTGDFFMIECERCGKKNTVSTENAGFNQLIDLWTNEEINTEEYKKLEDDMQKIIDKRIKSEKPKKKKSPKKKNKGAK